MIELIVRYYQENPNLFKITLIVLILSVVIGIGVIIAYKAVRKKRQQNESKKQAIDELSESAPAPSYDDPTERSLSEVKTARPEKEPIVKSENEEPGADSVEEKSSEKPAPVKEPTAEKPDKNTNEKPDEKPAEKPSEEKDNATRQKYKGKWIITETDGKYSAVLTALNGEVLLRSETYTSLSGIKSGIDTITKNILKDNFAYAIDKKGKYFFKIHSSATRLLCVSEMSGTRSMCESAIASVKKYAESAEIIFDKTDNA